MSRRYAAEIERLLGIMTRLRDPDGGCPWDLEQNFTTIAPYTIEEAYEVAEAIRSGDMTALRDELGDLLLQVVFHAQMAREAKAFDFADVARAIADKMVRRHPHVFGAEQVPDAAAQTVAWEEHKAAEREAASEDGRQQSHLDGLPLALPALTRAEKLQRRAARVGFDWPGRAPVRRKVDEELAELDEALARDDRANAEDELGDLLFACVNLARHMGVDPEETLRRANAKFERRFRRVESLLAEAGISAREAGLAQMDRLWNRVKEEERR